MKKQPDKIRQIVLVHCKEKIRKKKFLDEIENSPDPRELTPCFQRNIFEKMIFSVSEKFDCGDCQNGFLLGFCILGA